MTPEEAVEYMKALASPVDQKANDGWIPRNKLPNGYKEIVIDLSETRKK